MQRTQVMAETVYADEPWLVSFARPVDGSLPGWVGVLHFRRPRDRVECVEVTYTYVDDVETIEELRVWLQDRQLGCLPPLDVPPGGVTAQMIRLLKLGEFQTEARARMASKAPDAPGWALPAGWSDSSVRPGPKRQRPKDRDYADLARRYHEHFKNDPSTDPAIPLAREEICSISAMRNRLTYARKRGFLTSPGRGRIGGEITPLARQILKEKRH